MNVTWFAQGRLYAAGDYVYPTDLPRRHLCRVAAVDDFDAGGIASQVLKLDPVAGPWPIGTYLVRLNSMVVRASESWRAATARRGSFARHRRRHLAHDVG